MQQFFYAIFRFGLPVFLLISFLNTPLSISAQQKGNPYRSSVKGEEPLALRMGGFVYKNYWGAKIGLDYPIKIVESRQLQGLFGGRSFREWYISADLSLLHVGNFAETRVNGFEISTLSFELTHRRMNGGGYFLQGSIGVGGNYVLPAFLPDSSYLPPKFNADHDWFLTPSVSAAIGRDFAVGGRYRRGFPLVVLVRGNWGYMLALPKFERAYLVPSLELAFAYRFASWQVATRHVRRS